MSIIRPTLAQIAKATLGPLASSRLPWELADAGGTPGLNLRAGTFTRSTEGSYLTGAPTDGTAAFLAWAGVDVRRIENRGDGLGPMLLMEGSRTNKLLQSRAFATSPWAAAGGGSVSPTADQGPGPDGTTVADRITVDGTHYSWAQNTTGVANPHVLSGYVRAFTGTSPWQANYGGGAWTGATVGTTWSRKDHQFTIAALLYPEDGTLSGVSDLLVDLWQAEDGVFPSSPIRTTVAAVTRGADSLSYAANQYPASFLDRGFRFTFVPDNSSGEHVASGNTQRVVYCNSGTNLLQLQSGAATAQFYCNGTLIPAAITWARGSVIVFTLEPTLGRMTISGALTGNGTVSGVGAAWPSAALYVGNDNTGNNPAFGRFGLTMVPV